jgi:predicted transcriptional regulator
MSYPFPPELDRLVRQKLASGEYTSEDEVLLEAMHALVDRDEALAGIQEGLDDMQAGRTRPLREVDAELRNKHDIRRDRRRTGSS